MGKPFNGMGQLFKDRVGMVCSRQQSAPLKRCLVRVKHLGSHIIEPGEDMPGRAHVAAPAAFGSLTGLLILTLSGFGSQRLEKQDGFINHLLSQTAVGRLVVLPKR